MSRLLMQLVEGKFRRPVDRHEHVELAFGCADFGNVDMEIADWVGLERLLVGFTALHLGQPRDTVALQAAMQ